MANLIMNRQKSIQTLHCDCGVFNLIHLLKPLPLVTKKAELLRPQLSLQSFLSQSCADAPRSQLRKWVIFGSWFWLFNSGVARLTRASRQKLKIVQTRGGHGWSLTWGGTPASGPDVHAALEMQNLSSGIFPRSLTTSVEDAAEEKYVQKSTQRFISHVWFNAI